MTKTFTLSNVHQFVALAKTKPQLLDVGQLGSLRPAVEHKGCNCKANFNWEEYREKFELSMQLLDTEQMNRLKMVLQTQEVCYNYKKPTGGIGLMCI